MPREVLIERIQSSKFTLIVRVSVATLIVVLCISAATLFLKISQNQEIEKANNSIKTAENNVVALKNREETLFALKNRLNTIQALKDSDEKVKSMLNLIIFLTPPEVAFNDASVDKNGTIIASFNTKSLSAVEIFLSNLSNKEKNSNLVSKVDLDGISLGKNYIYRFALKIYSAK